MGVRVVGDDGALEPEPPKKDAKGLGMREAEAFPAVERPVGRGGSEGLLPA